MNRPYYDKTVTELESIFHSNCNDRGILQMLLDELELRPSNQSRILSDKIDILLEREEQIPIALAENKPVSVSDLLIKLKPLRDKLIDLSLRNRLLNYSDRGSQTLQVLPCDLDKLYKKLVIDETELQIEGVPKAEARNEATESPEDEAIPPSNRPRVDFSGDDTTHDIEQGTLRSRDAMVKTENRMTALFRKYRECLDTLGSNLCFMAFGFLEWTDPYRQDGGKLYAPLILVPVALAREKREVVVETNLDDVAPPRGRGRPRAIQLQQSPKIMAYRFTVKHDGADVSDNVALRLKLEGLPGGISLPSHEDLADAVSIEAYMKTVEEAIKAIPPEVNTGWKVVRGVRLAFFSSAKEAIYRDLDPAKDADYSLVKREWIQAVLYGRDPDTSPAVEDVDITNALHIKPIPTVLETDSSQMKALVRVLRGDSIVIQGPPGTGKSQTITNIIAATLAKGKSVLFVAEKMAALRVVRQRMEESGLGRYCLELHSAKATTRQVLEQVSKRLTHIPAAPAGGPQMNADRELLNQFHMSLGHYGNSIHRKDNSLELSFHEAVWRRSQLFHALEKLLCGQNVSAESLPALTLREEASYSEFSTLLNALKVAGRCIAEGVHLAAQPWYGSSPRELPSPQMEETVRRTLGNAKLAAVEWQTAETRMPVPDLWSSLTANDWLKLHHCFQPGPAPELSAFMCHELAADFNSIFRYEKYLEALAAWREPQPEAARALSENSTITRSTIEESSAAAKQIERTLLSRMPHATLEELSDSSQKILWLRDALASRTATLAALAEMLHVPITDDTFMAGCRLAAFGARIANLPLKVWRCIDSALLHPSTPTHLVNAKMQYRILEDERNEICAELRLDDLMSASDWKTLSRDLRLTAGNWFNWLPGTRGNKLRQQLRVCFYKQPVSETAAMDAVDRAQNWIAKAAAFSTAEDHRLLLGSAFTGMNTDWISLDAAVSLTAEWVNLFGVQSAKDFVLEYKDSVFANALTIADFAEKSEAYMNEWMVLASTLFCQDEATLRQLSTKTLYEDISQQAGIAVTLVETIAKVNLPTNTQSNAVPHLCSVAITLRELANTVAELTANPNFLGSWHQGLLATDLLRIANALQWLRKLIETESLPRDIKVWALSESTSQRVHELTDGIELITKAIGDWQTAMMPLTTVFTFDSPNEPISPNNLDQCVMKSLSQLDAAIEAVPSLLQWYHLRESEREIEQAGGKSLWQWCREHVLDVEATQKAAHLGFSNHTIERLLTQYPELATYHRQKIEEHRDGFRVLDKHVLDSFKNQVDHSIFRDHRGAPTGQRKGSPKDYTEMFMLRHEMDKQRAHVPVRKLVKQSGAALKYLMPCWMMGPMAVAQFLEPGIEFDLLIMDEASQVRPEDALGSLARAKQIVIVGDSKQMPPTDVFQALGVRDTDDEVENEEGDMISASSAALDSTSILDVFEKQLPSETLLWHYRSQHQNLIAFSNENYYNSSLIVPPSSWHASDELGIVRHYLPHGTFHDRKNEVEANEIVKIMFYHVERESKKLVVAERETLGVVAMNAVQQELIADLWEKKCLDKPDIVAALKEFESKTSLFIRNLENVQGDERDVIIISTTYAKNREDVPSQRFGPINKAGGWRRLNVLFTRARKRLMLVTSLESVNVIMDEKNVDSGRNYLKKYLEYAETGDLPSSGKGFKGEPESGFEESVAGCLNDLGYRFHYQVGAQGFFIDIGVIDPRQPDKYLCGIECDGATYHSHPIARDRDRIRQEILEDRGWKIFRIWSTDWHRNRTLEINRLREYLSSLSRG